MNETRFNLSPREQKVLNLLWKNPDGLTSIDIHEQLNDIMPNATYVHRSLNVLIKKGFITDNGSVRCGKQYARKFIAAIPKDEFVIGLLKEKEIDLSSLSVVNTKQNFSEPNKEKLIEDLQDIISNLKKNTI